MGDVPRGGHTASGQDGDHQLVTAYHLAAAGMAATIIDDRFVVNRNEPLRFFALGSDRARRSFHIVLLKNTYIPITTRRLVEHLLAEVKRADAGRTQPAGATAAR